MATYNQESVSVLNELIETLRDGEQGFRTGAQGLQNTELQQLFLKFSEQRAQLTDELQKEVRKLGADPEERGSVAGALHRGWINIKSAVTGKDDAAIVSEAERGEDVAVRAYENAFKKNLPQDLRETIHRQYIQIKEAHDRVREFERRFQAVKP